MRMGLFYIIASFIVAALYLTGVAYAAADNTPQSCEPVAVLFGQTVCAQALQDQMSADVPDSNLGPAPPQPPSSADLSDRERQDALRHELWKIALEEKFGPDLLIVDEEGLTTYQAMLRQRMARSHDANLQVAALLQEALDNDAYSPADRRVIKDLLDAVEASIFIYEKREDHTEAMPEHFSFVPEEAAREVARKALRQWQIDKALYDEYGGRLIKAGSRIIPIDAYRDFGRFIMRNGAPEIKEPALQTAIDGFGQDVKLQDKAILPDSDPAYQYYFEDPQWQLKQTSPFRRIDKLKAWLSTRK